MYSTDIGRYTKLSIPPNINIFIMKIPNKGAIIYELYWPIENYYCQKKLSGAALLYSKMLLIKSWGKNLKQSPTMFLNFLWHLPPPAWKENYFAPFVENIKVDNFRWNILQILLPTMWKMCFCDNDALDLMRLNNNSK